MTLSRFKCAVACLITASATFSAGLPQLQSTVVTVHQSKGFDLRRVNEVKGNAFTRIIYQQSVGGVDIYGATVEFVVDAEGREVLSNDSSFKGESLITPPKSKKSDLVEKAWAALGGPEKSLSTPKITPILWKTSSNELRSATKIEVVTQNPSFTGFLILDDETGDVALKQSSIYSHSKARQEKGHISGKPYKSAKQFEAKQPDASVNKTGLSGGLKGGLTGQATVWNPNPRIVLKDMTLQYNAAPSILSTATVSEVLPEITYEFPEYTLSGTRFQLADFDIPTRAPIRSSDGIWTYLPGSDGFRDANAYFHLLNASLKLESLGYSLIDFQIQVDTEALGGSDNSGYDFTNHRLLFGGGCVPDAEDADIVRHEYGHAIHFAANPTWSGADLGAITEGFADFFALSLRWQQSGTDTAPAYFATWDGHNSCWPGRKHDRLESRYRDGYGYLDHESVDGIISDELWGTPLVQSVLQHADSPSFVSTVDAYQKAAIDGFIGVVGPITMPNMARAISRALFLSSGETLASESFAQFKKYNILPNRIKGSLTGIEDAEGRIVALPGQTISLKTTVENNFYKPLTGVHSEVSSSDDKVAVVHRSVPVPDMESAQKIELSHDGAFLVRENVACGDQVIVKQTITQADSEPLISDHSIRVGRPVYDVKRFGEVPIPDGNATGLKLQFDFSHVDRNADFDETVEFNLELSHPFLSDLTITLKTPGGALIPLRRQGSVVSEQVSISPRDPSSPLRTLLGKPLSGVWTVFVADKVAQDAGRLVSAQMRYAKKYNCSLQDNRAPIAVITGPSYASGKTSVNLSGLSTRDEDGDELTYSWSQRSGPEATISGEDSSYLSITLPDVNEPTNLEFELSVTDGLMVSKAVHSILVTKAEGVIPGTEHAHSKGGGGSMYAGVCLILAMLAVLRRQKRGKHVNC